MNSFVKEEHFEVGCEGVRAGTPPEPCLVVIFGASGDLSHKELLPSFYALSCKGLLPDSFAIVGTSRRDWDDDAFRAEMAESVRNEVSSFTEESWKAFAKRVFYVSGNIDDEPSASYAKLKQKIESVRKQINIPDNILFHFSTAPRFYGTIVSKLDAASLLESTDGWRRLVIEKPFGEDEETARSLDRELLSVLREEQIYRVDHYLGKETVQNMLVFRFANPGFEPIWNRHYIDHVQITVAEDAGIRDRAGFYETTGVVRDMVQNHLLQLLCMTAIEPPGRYEAGSLRAETVKVLKAIRPIQVEKDVVLGQYDAGSVNGQQAKSYREEKDVKQGSMTATFVALRLTVDNWRWAGVPFYLRTGKRLPQKVTEVTIQFKPTPHLMFPRRANEMRKNMLTFRLQPNEGIIYEFLAKQPGAEMHLEPVKMNFRYDAAFGIQDPPSAYEWLLLDAMHGEQTLFPRSDWILKAWQIIDPVVKKWEQKPWIPFPNYTAGSWGPEAADRLIQADGREWYVA